METIPPWQFKAHCPRCGAELSIKHEAERFPVELKGNERMLCPVHGDVMSLEEARRVAFQENRDEAVNKIKEAARNSLRDAIKKQ